MAESEISEVSSTGADDGVEAGGKVESFPIEAKKSAAKRPEHDDDEERNEDEKEMGQMTESAVELQQRPMISRFPRRSLGAFSTEVQGELRPRRPAVNFPLLYVAPTGTISVLLHHDVIVEVAVDKAIRVVCCDKFAAASNGRGTSSCILHHDARVFQQDTKVYSSFVGDKAAVLGSQGVLFAMKRMSEAYLVSSSTLKGTSAIPMDRLRFPDLDTDFSLQLFYVESQTGEGMMEMCGEIVRRAHYERREDGTVVVNVNGVYIRQERSGDVDVNCRPRHLRFSPSRSTVRIRTHFVDMAVQEDQKSYVKRGVKRVHVSRSGMVVSDGNCITSMDHYGRIVSST
uniref:Uncharacterized protein n=1 Tax=Plectus sambesii TaxID=2011161 RepID=A0A914W042_9BILA